MRLCPHCNDKKVTRVKGNFPFTLDHLQCETCDSTFCDDKHYNRERAKAFRNTRCKPQAYAGRDNRAGMRKSRYGITDEQYHSLLKDCDSKCAICDSYMVTPHCDHNHSTGNFRSLLCSKCNTFVGFVESNPGLVDKVLSYIKSHG